MARSLNSLAAVRWNQRRLDEAEPLFEKALAAKEQALGRDHAELATTLVNLGVLKHSQKKYAEAAALYARALQLFEKRQEKNDEIETLEYYVPLLKRMGRTGEALPLEGRLKALRDGSAGKGPAGSQWAVRDASRLSAAPRQPRSSGKPRVARRSVECTALGARLRFYPFRRESSPRPRGFASAGKAASFVNRR